MLSVIMLSVIMLNVVMLSVGVPFRVGCLIMTVNLPFEASFVKLRHPDPRIDCNTCGEALSLIGITKL
jgi:hypothetical protein